MVEIMNSIILFLGIASAVAAVPLRSSHKIVGGAVTTIDHYPFATPLLFSSNLAFYSQSCGGTILNSNSVLSAAHCFHRHTPNRWRIRVGSSHANSGGTVFNVARIITHPLFDSWGLDNDVAVLKTDTRFTYGPNVQPATIAGHSYNVAANQEVWAVGWGSISVGGPLSEQLRHVKIWSVDQSVCVGRYSEIGWTVTDNMLCSGWLDVGGRDQCQGDSGGPLLHNKVVVGICSWGYQCALSRFPGVNAKVSKFTSWIVSQADS